MLLQRASAWNGPFLYGTSAGWSKLTQFGVLVTLERFKWGRVSRPCLRLLSPIGWEVVQLVGLQILDLAILVRVQASQPNLLQTRKRDPLDSATIPR
jgi:hypothetical protein